MPDGTAPPVRPVRRPRTGRTVLVVAALAAVVVLVGCSGAPGVDERALTAWEQQQDAAAEQDGAGLGVLTARIDPGADTVSDAGSEVRLQFPAAQTVDHIAFSCFGNGSVRAVVRVTSASGSSRTVTDPVSCRDGPHRIVLRTAERTGVSAVAGSAFDSDRPSAWRMVIVGG